jgi:hypothetical protein
VLIDVEMAFDRWWFHYYRSKVTMKSTNAIAREDDEN